VLGLRRTNMDKFEASNGLIITLTNARQTGYCRYPEVRHDATGHLGFSEMVAWREFFQAERDEELGRWRWPENPDYVVYPDDDGDVIVLNERDGMSGIGQTRATVDRYPNSFGADAARAYFESHPERKPWHDAKEGEVWVLTLDGDEIPYMARPSIGNNVYFEGVIDGIKPDSTMITAGRRIYPEEP
jgi:hypothetical protein